MHDAFRVVNILDKLPLKIESITHHGHKLLVGTSEGALLEYEIRDSGNGAFSIHLLNTRKSFSKRPIEQLQAIEAIGILLCLTDGIVNVYDLATLTLKSQFNKSKGANLFAIDEPHENLFPYRLCISLAKKLSVFEWHEDGFIDIRELEIPKKALGIAFCSDSLCVEFPQGYVLIHIGTGQVTDLFSISKTSPMPIVLPSKELLLAKDNVSIFKGFDGKPTRKFGLNWSEPPEMLVYSFPYVLAILPKGIEVQAIETQSLVQTIPLIKPKMMTGGNVVYVASQNAIWRLVPIPLKVQIDQLVENKEFEEALHLLQAIEDNQYNDRLEKIKNVKRLYAFNLFAKKQFVQSMTIFQEINCDPAEVIGLFPDLLPPDLKSQFNYPVKIPTLEKKEDYENALHALIQFLTDKRRMFFKASKANEGSEELEEAKQNFKELGPIIDTSLLKAYLHTNNNLVGSLLRLPNFCHVKESEKMLNEHKKYVELVDLYYGKGLHAQALQHLAKHGQKGNVSDPLNGVGPTVNYLRKLQNEYPQTPIPTQTPTPNENSTQTQNQNQNQNQPPTQNLLPQEIVSLILEYSTWVLTSEPNEGLKIFVDEYAEDDRLPHDRVYTHLQEKMPRLTVPYLEFIIQYRNEKTPFFHNTLVKGYLDNVLKNTEQKNGVVVEELRNNDRKKLVTFLEKSIYYNPEKLLTSIPKNDLYEEKAILLSRLGQHRQALLIYAYNLENPEFAENYCKKHYGTEKDQSPSVYLDLFDIYLNPPPEFKTKIDLGLNLLIKYFDKMDTGKVLGLLPKDIDVKKVYPFLESVLRENSKKLHENQIQKNLLKSEQLQVQEQRIHYQSRKVVITHEKMCAVCNKRIGNSVFALYPNGKVVHYSCKDKE